MAQQCGAKTRSGTPCKGKAMPNGRCRMHGGKNTGAPKNNMNSATPGSLYSKFLTPEEHAQFSQIEIGRIDDELRLMRIRLARALSHEHENGDKPELEAVTARTNHRDGNSGEKVFKRRDHTAVIDRIIGRIESLERTRIELEKAGASDDDGMPESRSFTYTIVDGRKGAEHGDPD